MKAAIRKFLRYHAHNEHLHLLARLFVNIYFIVILVLLCAIVNTVIQAHR